MLARSIYLAFAGLTLAGYVVTEQRGAVLATAEEKVPLPPDLKNNRGGYRSHSFWHVGYMGGK